MHGLINSFIEQSITRITITKSRQLIVKNNYKCDTLFTRTYGIRLNYFPCLLSNSSSLSLAE